jgi:hypothetical protein
MADPKKPQSNKPTGGKQGGNSGKKGGQKKDK